MADLKDTIEKLKLVEQEMDVYKWYQEAGLGDAVRDAIERLTAKTMTREQVAAILNRHVFLGHSIWFASSYSTLFFLEVDANNVSLDEYSAFAVAEKLVREKEAARG